MNPNFTFDAEGVFDQQIKPLRPRKRRTQRWRRWWIALTKGDTLDTRAIKQTMRCPKLLAASMPRVILQEEFLQRPRSAESEFGLKSRRHNCRQLNGAQGNVARKHAARVKDGKSGDRLTARCTWPILSWTGGAGDTMTIFCAARALFKPNEGL